MKQDTCKTDNKTAKCKKCKNVQHSLFFCIPLWFKFPKPNGLEVHTPPENLDCLCLREHDHLYFKLEFLVWERPWGRDRSLLGDYGYVAGVVFFLRKCVSQADLSVRLPNNLNLQLIELAGW